MIKIKKSASENFLQILGVAFRGEMFNKLLGFPDKRKFNDGKFFFISSHINIKYAIVNFPDADWLDCAKNYKDDYFNFIKQEEENLENKSKNLNDFDVSVFKTKPLHHQLQCFNLSKDLEFYGLFFEQGCGKTKVVIDTANYLFLTKKIESIVIVAPNGVHKNWLSDEMPKHSKLQYDEFLWDGNFSKEKIKKFEKMISDNSKLKIFSFNIECFGSVAVKQKDILKTILTKNKCLLVIDESQTIKNHKAKRTKFFLSIQNLAKYRRILTGTAITKGFEDIYTQFYFLSPDIIGISTFYGFCTRYCITKQMTSSNKKFQKITGYSNVEELQNKIQAYTYRVLKKDCLDLPEKIYQKEFFDLSVEQKKHYDAIKNEGITFIKLCKEQNIPISFESVLVRLKKMQQIALGYMLNVEEKSIIEIVKPEDNPRLLKLKEIIDKINGKIIIWTIYTQDIIYIKKMLGDQAVRYDGKISEDEKFENKKSFKENPKIKYLIANTQSMARGHTLTEAETSIYYCNSFDLELRLQSEDRNHRQGTKNNVLYIDIQANKTLDSKIINALRHKKKIADFALQDPENFFME